MIKGGLARGTMAWFASAFASFVLAQVLIVSGLSYPTGPTSGPWSLVATHLLTIGWLTTLILGALRQFVPVIAGTKPRGDRSALWALFAIDAGLFGMILGFLALGGVVAMDSFPWLPLGGTVVVVGVAVAAVPLVGVLRAARPLPLPARFVASGLAFLAATIVIGTGMGFGLARPDGLPAGTLGPLIGTGLPLHVSLGVGGWFTLTAMGVAYKLLAMFTLAPEERGAAGRWAFRLSAGGLSLFAVARLVAALGAEPRIAGFASWLGGLAAAAGLAVFLADMRKMYGERRRRELELNGAFGAWALVGLGAAAALVLAWAVTSAFDRPALGAATIVYAFVFGWLSGLGLSQMYKIVPFLTWIERFGSQLGRGRVPRVQDLVNEPRARPWFVLYFVSVGACLVLALAEDAALFRVGAAATLLASLLVGLEVWRARHARPEAPGAAAPPARPPWLGEAVPRAGGAVRGTDGADG